MYWEQSILIIDSYNTKVKLPLLFVMNIPCPLLVLAITICESLTNSEVHILLSTESINTSQHEQMEASLPADR